MILATLRGGGADGTLVVVSRDRQRFALPERGPRTLQEALDHWDRHVSALEESFGELDIPTNGLPTDRASFMSPLPRTYHWAEGSCYLGHMERIRASRGEDLPPEYRTELIAYQSGGERHLAPLSTFALPEPDWQLDMEATVAVITGDIPIGATPKEAADEVRLVGLTNDLTYRTLIVQERRMGNGTYHSKPGRAYAPFVVSPATLGSLWDGSTLHAVVRSEINADVIGETWADKDVTFKLPHVLTHLTKSRPLVAGSIVGTGTISNEDPAAGFSCIAEKRAVEIVDRGEAHTSYLGVGDVVRVEAFAEDGTSLFGRIEQTIVST